MASLTHLGEAAIVRALEEKRPLGFGELWNMNFGYLGIQFGWGLQMANMAAIYTKLGAHPDNIPLLGLAGPVTGLLIQPIIGAMSDRTWSPKYGRRRPYFTVGALLASLVLFFMPTSPALWVAATLLWVLDASINVSMEPFRAFVADKLPPKQRAAGFLMQSFFIGLGATLATVLPWVLHHAGVTSEASNGVPLSVLYSFRIGAFVFILAVLWTVLRTPEDPPMDMAAFEQHRRENSRPGGRGAGDSPRGPGHAGDHAAALLGSVATWFGLSCTWGLFTLAVASHIFGTTDSASPLFDRATEWAGVCMAASSVVCFLARPSCRRSWHAWVGPGCTRCRWPSRAWALLSVALIHSPNSAAAADGGLRHRAGRPSSPCPTRSCPSPCLPSAWASTWASSTSSSSCRRRCTAWGCRSSSGTSSTGTP